MTSVSSRAFWLPKAGNSDADYEDAYSIGEDCVAIADGATESSFARLWAQGLADAFTRAPHMPIPRSLRRLQEWLQPLQQAWYQSVPWDRLPWFAEDKAREGAFSSLLAFEFRSFPHIHSVSAEPMPAERRWQALAVGDSCLFQVREDALRIAFPLQHSEQFNSRPSLLSSNPANNHRVWDELTLIQGAYRPGDLLLFATDALARWFLAQYEAGGKPWQTLCELQDQDDFAELIAELRAEHALRNDDVTLVILRQEIGVQEVQEQEAQEVAHAEVTEEQQSPPQEIGVEAEASR